MDGFIILVMALAKLKIVNAEDLIIDRIPSRLEGLA